MERIMEEMSRRPSEEEGGGGGENVHRDSEEAEGVVVAEEDSGDDDDDSDDDEPSLLERLENGDPAVKVVDHMRVERGEELRLLRALSPPLRGCNPHVEEVLLDARFASDERRLELLLRFLRGGPSLRRFSCYNWDGSVAAATARALRALSDNGGVRTVSLVSTTVPVRALAGLLRRTGSLVELEVVRSGIVASAPAATGGGGGRGERQHQREVAKVLSSGFVRNNTLEVLKVVNDRYPATVAASYAGDDVVPLLRAAASLSKLRELILQTGEERSVEVGAAVGRMLEESSASPTRLETLRLHGWRWNAESFRPVALGLKNSAVTRVEFGGPDTSFDRESTELFLDAFLSGGRNKLRALALDTRVRFSSSPLGNVLAEVVGAGDSSLKDLELTVCSRSREFSFDVLLQALQRGNCRLENLILKEGLGQVDWQVLIEGVPRFHSLKMLSVTVERHSYLSVRDAFIRACWRNDSLLEIRIGSMGEQGEEMLHSDDFDSIVARNRGLKRFRDDPTEQPLSLWNSIFVRALECNTGHDLINDTLRGRVESQWWNQASNKRRRIAPPEK
jgi:hypothetical protein